MPNNPILRLAASYDKSGVSLQVYDNYVLYRVFPNLLTIMINSVHYFAIHPNPCYNLGCLVGDSYDSF